jgi:hypothetical protein
LYRDLKTSKEFCASRGLQGAATGRFAAGKVALAPWCNLAEPRANTGNQHLALLAVLGGLADGSAI